MSKCLWGGWKWQKENKEITSPFACCPMNRKYSWKKSQIKKANYALQHVRKEQTCMYDGWRASGLIHEGGRYYTETSPLICSPNQRTGLYTTGTSVMKELMLFYLHVYIEIHFLNYEKIIDIYASKHQRRMLLSTPLSKN